MIYLLIFTNAYDAIYRNLYQNRVHYPQVAPKKITISHSGSQQGTTELSYNLDRVDNSTKGGEGPFLR